MTKANLRLFLLAGAAASTAFAAAQTSTSHHTPTATHRTGAHTVAHPVHSECITVPELSPKIPAVPAGTPCPRALVTISENIAFSPLVGPDLRSMFPNLPMSFSLGYQDTHIGTGEPAKPHMYYTVKYTGYLPDGTKFDSSEDHPEIKEGISFPYGGHRVIPGWDMGFEGMHLGGKRRLFVPYQLAYGERGNPRIPPKSNLIFDMELVSQSATNPNPPPTPPQPPAGANPGAPGPGGTLPATPPTGAPGTAPQPPAHPQAPSAQPQGGPDVKPAPPATGSPSSPQTPPPTAKQPPPSGL